MAKLKCPKCGKAKTLNLDAIDAVGRSMVGGGPMPSEPMGVGGLTGHPSALAGLWGSAADKPLIHGPCGVAMVREDTVAPELEPWPDEDGEAK